MEDLDGSDFGGSDFGRLELTQIPSDDSQGQFFVPLPECPTTGSPYPPVHISSDREIRIFSLFPGKPDHRIFGELEIHNLQEPVQPYEALSYVWGTWDDTRLIGLDDCPQSLYITSNLWKALRRLRYLDRPRRLWIDQICIRQWHFPERNQQVHLMGRIYQQADRVIVWLGDGDYDNEEASQNLMCKSDTKCPVEGLTDEEIGRQAISDVAMDATISPLNPAYADGAGLSLRRALAATGPQMQWWTRLWVVQEVANASKDPHVAFGSFTLPWDTTWSLPALLNRSEPARDLAVVAKRFRGLKDVNRRREGILSMIDIVTRGACRDKLDKVYALLDLIVPHEKEMITLDYTKSASTVFAEATYASIVSTESYSIMDLLIALPEPTTSMASWTFDFATVRPISPRYYRIPSRPIQWTRERACTTLCADINTLKLRVYAYRFGQIALAVKLSATGPVTTSQKETTHIRREMRKSAQDVLRLRPYDHLSPISRLPHSWFAGVAAGLNYLSNLLIDFGVSLPQILRHEYEDTVEEDVLSPMNTFDEQTRARKPFWRRLFHIRRGVHTHNNIADNIVTTRTLDRVSQIRNPAFIGWKVARSLPNYWSGHVGDHCARSCFVLTDAGFVVAAPRPLEEGDEVALPFGGHAPMILRQVSDSTWRFVCFAYVYGIMEGELRTEVPHLELPEIEYTLE